MTRSEKSQVIEDLKVKFSESQYFYFADASTLTVEQVNKLRRTCFEKGIEVQVVKNTLAQKAMEASGEMAENFEGLYSALAGPTTVFFADTGNAPAKVIKEFRKSFERPILKAAYIDSDIFLGDDQLDILATLKSKDELVGEIIGLLQSPAKNVISALKSSGGTIAGILKTLEERG
ncbi:MAG: large subunit ribosomal protein L10 [Saprospiraceae bacterium]|jgi:large subunit ribosomal protein L10|tara:strand:+ start:684 stop:1211 length:528 start_codon:yes stop_codon:yes gene_type:complete